MTSKEYVIWLKGFTKGVHEFNITPKQWSNLKDTLNEVSDEPARTSSYGSITLTSGSNGTATSTNSFPSFTITSTNQELLLDSKVIKEKRSVEEDYDLGGSE